MVPLHQCPVCKRSFILVDNLTKHKCKGNARRDLITLTVEGVLIGMHAKTKQYLDVEEFIHEPIVHISDQSRQYFNSPGWAHTKFKEELNADDKQIIKNAYETGNRGTKTSKEELADRFQLNHQYIDSYQINLVYSNMNQKKKKVVEVAVAGDGVSNSESPGRGRGRGGGRGHGNSRGRGRGGGRGRRRRA